MRLRCIPVACCAPCFCSFIATMRAQCYGLCSIQRADLVSLLIGVQQYRLSVSANAVCMKIIHFRVDKYVYKVIVYRIINN